MILSIFAYLSFKSFFALNRQASLVTFGDAAPLARLGSGSPGRFGDRSCRMVSTYCLNSLVKHVTSGMFLD